MKNIQYITIGMLFALAAFSALLVNTAIHRGTLGHAKFDPNEEMTPCSHTTGTWPKATTFYVITLYQLFPSNIQSTWKQKMKYTLSKGDDISSVKDQIEYKDNLVNGIENTPFDFNLDLKDKNDAALIMIANSDRRFKLMPKERVLRVPTKMSDGNPDLSKAMMCVFSYDAPNQQVIIKVRYQKAFAQRGAVIGNYNIGFLYQIQSIGGQPSISYPVFVDPKVPNNG